MLNEQFELYQHHHVSKPSHDTIAFNHVEVGGRCFRLWGKYRDEVIECDTLDANIPVWRDRLGVVHYGKRVIGRLSACDVRECSNNWHIRPIKQDGMIVTNAMLHHTYSDTYLAKTRMDIVRSYAEAYIAAGN